MKNNYKNTGEERVREGVESMCTCMCKCFRTVRFFLLPDTHMDSPSGKVYGVPLMSHLLESGRQIAMPIEECVHMLLNNAMREEVSSPYGRWDSQCHTTILQPPKYLSAFTTLCSKGGVDVFAEQG